MQAERAIHLQDRVTTPLNRNATPPATEPAWLLALLRAPGIGPVRFARLLAHLRFGGGGFAADHAELRQLDLPDTALDALRQPDWRRVEQDLAWLERPNNHLLQLDDPATRRCCGKSPIHHRCCSSTATRLPEGAATRHRRHLQPDPARRETAHHFAAHLAGAGLVITGGLALGIDAAAHQGALAGGGPTIAVMGTSLDRVYPARHRGSAHAIAERGALLSELPIGTPPIAENFPGASPDQRAGLGVLVVEAALRSGSLITARQALDQGREVFAIPGSIHNPLVKGCHALIRQGAKLVETAADVLEELGARGVRWRRRRNPTAAPPASEALDEDYQQLLAAMNDGPLAVDSLVERCGLTAEVVFLHAVDFGIGRLCGSRPPAVCTAA